MLPYPTDPRRLLMMVRVFLHEFAEFVSAHRSGWDHPSDPDDPCVDHQLEAFLERLAADAGEIDEHARRTTGRIESAAEIPPKIAAHLRQLVQDAFAQNNRLTAN